MHPCSLPGKQVPRMFEAVDLKTLTTSITDNSNQDFTQNGKFEQCLLIGGGEDYLMTGVPSGDSESSASAAEKKERKNYNVALRYTKFGIDVNTQQSLMVKSKKNTVDSKDVFSQRVIQTYTMQGGGVKTLMDVELKKNEKSCNEICNNSYSCLVKVCVSNVDPSTLSGNSGRRKLGK